MNHLVQRRGLEVANGETARHTGMPGPNVRHAHDVVEDAGHPASVGMPRRSLKSLSKNHGPRDLVEFLLPSELGRTGMASSRHRHQFSHDIVHGSPIGLASHFNQAADLLAGF